MQRAVTVLVLVAALAGRAGAAPATVAGFPLTDYVGVAAPDGSVTGTGRLRLAIAGSVLARFELDARGRVRRGAFTGPLAIAGRAVPIAGGVLDESGLHWRETVSLPPAPPVTVDCALAASGLVTTTGVVEVTVAGARVPLTVTVDGTGRFAAAVRRDLVVAGFPIRAATLRLDAGGLTGAGQLVVDGRPIEAALRLTPTGELTATLQVPLQIALPGGRVLLVPGPTLTFGPGGARGRGDVEAGGLRLQNARFNLTPDGGIAGGGAIAVGALTFTAAFSGSRSGFALAGTTEVRERQEAGGVGYELAAALTLAVSDGDARATVTGEVVVVAGTSRIARPLSASVDVASGRVTADVLGRSVTFVLGATP